MIKARKPHRKYYIIFTTDSDVLPKTYFGIPTDKCRWLVTH